ncbi:MAG: hypothetical protein QNJ75_00015 [Acidimicrobiia bacterium]|nr:hypothetical protein [Acidimicrobiia bacterium]
MIEPKDALSRLRSANLLPPGDELNEAERAAVVAECEQRVAVERGTAAPEMGRAGESLRPVSGGRWRWRPALVFSVAFVAVLAVAAVFALLNDSGGLILEPDVANTPPTTSAITDGVADPSPTTSATSDDVSPTTSAISDDVADAPPTPSGMVGDVAYINELVYYEDADRTLETSVFFPAEGDGPWPVVVVYSEYRRRAQEWTLARRIAERGAVVFSASWVDEYPASASEYLTGTMWERAACAVSYAQAQAGSYGGDPGRTTVVGDGGGEHPAAWVALGLADTSNCADPILYQPTGLAAGHSQWFFQEQQFDSAFASDDSGAVDTVDRFFNPERWEAAGDLSAFLWSTAYSGNANEINDPPSEESWIWSRDPDGDLVADLASVDAFDDGLITFRDNARLMNSRMIQSGVDVAHYESDNLGWGLDEIAFEGIWQVVAGR